MHLKCYILPLYLKNIMFLGLGVLHAATKYIKMCQYCNDVCR